MDQCVPSDWSALHLAVWKQDSIEDIRKLCSKSTVNQQDAVGWTAVRLACAARDSLLVLSHQISRRGKPGARLPYRLGHSAEEREIALKVLQVLLTYTPKLDTKARGFCTALHCAANSGWFSHVKLLVQAGAPVDTGSDCSPLCWSKGGSVSTTDIVSIYLRQQLGSGGLAKEDIKHASMGFIRQEGAAWPPLLPPEPKLEHDRVDANGLCKICASMSTSSMSVQPGHLHMPSLNDLRYSAVTCWLCRLISDQLGSDLTDDQRTISQIIVSLSNGNHFNCTEPQIIRSIDFKLSAGCLCNRRSNDDEPSPYFSDCKGLCKFVKEVSNEIYVRADKTPLEDQFIGAHSLGTEFRRNIQTGIDIHPEPLSQSTKGIILNWLEDCTSHVQCRSVSGSLGSVMPTRVIEMEQGRIRLLDSGGKHGLYLALSHRWTAEHEPIWVTNTKTVDARYSWFDPDELPPTILDAIAVTRHLGFRYLWIDSLCIIQDSFADKASEIANMANIFANAHMTIFADCAQDDNAGFLRNRPLEQSTPLTIQTATPNKPLTLYLRPPFDAHRETSRSGHPVNRLAEPSTGALSSFRGSRFRKSVQESYLSTRAWVYQERILSKRILHFGADRIFWECNEKVICEDGSVVTEDECGDCEPSFTKRGCSAAVHSRQVPHHDLLARVPALRRYRDGVDWTHVVTAYSRLHLTHGHDKLPALSGLASRYKAGVPDDRYIAGLWRSSLVPSLAWTVDRRPDQLCPRPSPSRIPSFSWIAVDDPVKFPSRWGKEWTQLAEFVSTDQEPRTIDPHGELRTGTLHLRGPMTEVVTLGPLAEKLGGLPKGYVPLYDDQMWPVGRLQANCANDGVEVGARLKCLHLLTPSGDYKPQNPEVMLVLAPVSKGVSGTDTYRRVGIGYMNNEYKAPEWDDWIRTMKVQTVVLV